jgi:DNA-binding response OmpR family regulator
MPWATHTEPDEILNRLEQRSGNRRINASKTHILAIDDEFHADSSLLRLLRQDDFVIDVRSHADFTVVTGTMFDDYHVVILDVMIADFDGFDLLRDICRNTQLPVLVLTTRSGAEDRIVGLELGADDYVAKPCRPLEVIARINALLRRRPRCNRLDM